MRMKTFLFDAVIFGFLLCTATGLFFESRDTLHEFFGFYARLALGCMATGTLISFITTKLKLNTLGHHLFSSVQTISLQEAKPWYKTMWGIQLIVAFISAFTVSIVMTEFNIKEIFYWEGAKGALRIFGGMANPNTDILPRAVLAMLETVFMAFLATTLAIPVAFILSFMCAKNIMGTTPFGTGVYFSLRMLLNLIRSMEPIVWAIIFSVWVNLGPFAGTLALMVHSIASLAKQYSEMVEAVDKGPIEGIQSTGAGSLQVLWFAIVPQVILPYVSFTIYRWDINVRMATIIGLVGGGGIGDMLIQYQNQAMWNEVGALILLIAFVVWVMDTSSAYIREAVK